MRRRRVVGVSTGVSSSSSSPFGAAAGVGKIFGSTTAAARNGRRRRRGRERSDVNNAATITGLRQGKQVISSARLQMLLHLNFYFSVVRSVLTALIIRYKSVNDHLDPVGAAFLTVWSINEMIRLYLGYVANLKEKVPHFAGFFFLTVLQLVLIIYQMGFQGKRLPIDVILGICDCIFIVGECLIAYTTMRAVIENKTARFDVELKAFLDDDDDGDDDYDDDDDYDEDDNFSKDPAAEAGEPRRPLANAIITPSSLANRRKQKLGKTRVF